MKTSILFIALFALSVVGCQKPNEIELTDDDSALEIETVATPDLNRELTPVDSAAILPRDEDKFAGFIYLSAIKTQSARGMDSRVFSRVVIEDRARPVNDSTGRRRGFLGLNFVSVRLNGEAMIERLRKFGTVVGGFEYVKELPSVGSRQLLTWQVNSLAFGTAEAAINTPEVLQVQSPVGGSVVSRNQDLLLKWTGSGEMGIILSSARFDGARLVTTPLLSVRVKKNAGQAKLSKKFLKGLPPASAYVFTFVLLNREEKVSLGRFNGKVLVQASSIYNSIVTLN